LLNYIENSRNFIMQKIRTTTNNTITVEPSDHAALNPMIKKSVLATE
jgi:hypothetical protein